MIDTAINCRGGWSEEILGQLLEGRAGNHRKNLQLSLASPAARSRLNRPIQRRTVAG